jgi:hypothetical protein
MRMWHTVIVESTRILEGQPLDLTETLLRLTADGWTIAHVLPNGVNRWTVIAWQDAA